MICQCHEIGYVWKPGFLKSGHIFRLARWLTKSKVNNIVHGKSLIAIGHVWAGRDPLRAVPFAPGIDILFYFNPKIHFCYLMIKI